MYIIYCLLLWAFVYLLPALAFFPALICNAHTAFAIPVISVFIIYLLSSLFIGIGAFNTATVTTLAITLGAIGISRLWFVIRKMPFTWSKQSQLIYGFHAILLLPYFVKLGTHAFDRGDEIYSWNFWAVQHYFNESIDFSHTGAPYPQLLPKLLAFCYHLLGNIDLQLPVKATLVIFPLSMLIAIAMTYRYWLKHLSGYLLLLIFILAGVGLEQFFNDGYADPVMTCGLVVSAVLFWFSQQSSLPLGLSRYYGLWSVLCAIAAAHTKQPALLWAMFSLPVMLWITPSIKKNYYRGLSVLSFMGGLSWLLTEGRLFHHNKGVLWLSLADRGIFSQFIYAINKYFVHQPLLFILFALAIGISRKEKILRQMIILFMIPSTLCWFFFGAYQLRLGQHIIAFAFFILMASQFKIPAQSFLQWVNGQQRNILWGCVGASLSISIVLFVHEAIYKKGDLSLYAGGRQSLQRYFEKDAHYIYKTIYSDKQALLWVPSRYLYGLFYRHTRLITPDYGHAVPYNKSALIKELQSTLPHYVFTASEQVVDGPASALLSEVLLECPRAFEKISSSDNRFSFVTYKINKILLQQDPCLLVLINAEPKEKPENVAFSH